MRYEGGGEGYNIKGQGKRINQNYFIPEATNQTCKDVK